MKHLLRELKTTYYQSLFNKRVSINLGKPIISFTFDDVPRSAYKIGLPILNRYNIYATYYVAMGLSDEHNAMANQGNKNNEIFIQPDDILNLHRSGHDVACHTYSHYMLDRGTAEGLESDSIRNIQELETLLKDSPIEHFSYPFGQVNFKAKRLLSRRYKTLRSSRPGINARFTDLYLLRAINIYNPTFNKTTIQYFIDKTSRLGGWLIFYTHGVCDNPDSYGCTPEQLEWVIQQSIDSGAQILPITQAYAHLKKLDLLSESSPVVSAK